MEDRSKKSRHLHSKQKKSHLEHLLDQHDLATLHGSSQINDDDKRVAAVQAADLAAVTRLYLHQCRGGPRCCPDRWSKFPSFADEEENLNKKTKKVPILHHHIYDNKKWITKSFVIQSPIIKGILRKALHNYQDLDMDLENWIFKPPYRALVHRWDELKEIETQLTDPVEKESATNLIQFLTPVLTSSIESLSLTRRTGKVSFDDVWQIFPPGVLALTTFFGVETICRVVKYEHKVVETAYWVITIEYVDWNGQSCGYETTTKTIHFFKGFRHVKELPVYALTFDEAPDEKRKQMLKRGRIFETFRGYHYLTCHENGRKVVSKDGRTSLKAVSGRIVIDAFAYFRANTTIRPVLRSLAEPIEQKTSFGTRSKKVANDSDFTEEDDSDSTEDEPVKSRSRPRSRSRHRNRPAPGMPPMPGMPSLPGMGPMAGMPMSGIPPPPPARSGFSYSNSSSNTRPTDGHELTVPPANEATSRNEDFTPLTDEQCMMATPWLRGMDLKTKEWGQFFVDELCHIEWNEDAFDNLVLPAEDKALTWDFVEAKSMSNNKYDDFIADKGRGTTILMFGPPGVGKTYTAEAVAEKSHAPLYAVSAGVLGTAPDEVEYALDQALDLCRLWKAILLLDEADVFLGARTNDSLLRNELVSIFLTKLEYYQGILFLTTNRISSIDHAFQSRIDLFLPYYSLTAQARRHVWKNFINHMGAENFEISESDLDKLSDIALNGREIKNLIKSAKMLSFQKGRKVETDRLYTLAEKRVKALQLLAEHPDASYN